MKRGTPTHTKTRRLCRVLKLKPYEAVGLLEMLWHLTASERPRGDIGALANEDIADALGWADCPDKLVEALVSCGWLDEHAEYRLLVHDWHVHADEAVQKRIERSGVGFATNTAPDSTTKGKRGRVYFIREPLSGNIKIGFTEGTPEARLAALQTAHHTQLELVGSIAGTHRTEGEWHRRFAAHALAGEWFKPAPELLEAIARGLPSAAVVRPGLPTADRDRLPEPEPEPEPEPSPEPAAAATVTVGEVEQAAILARNDDQGQAMRLLLDVGFGLGDAKRLAQQPGATPERVRWLVSRKFPNGTAHAHIAKGIRDEWDVPREAVRDTPEAKAKRVAARVAARMGRP